MGLRRRPARPLELDSEGEEGDETSGKEEESSSEKEEEQEEEGGLVKAAPGKVCGCSFQCCVSLKGGLVMPNTKVPFFRR